MRIRARFGDFQKIASAGDAVGVLCCSTNEKVASIQDFATFGWGFEMRVESTKLLWCIVFMLSVAVSLALFAELKGYRVLPESQSKLIDRSWVSKVIVAVFVFSLAVNARNTWFLVREGQHLRQGLRVNRSSGDLNLAGLGLLGLHANRMKQIYGMSYDGDISQTVSLGAIRSSLYGQEWFVRVASQILLTLGLIGTVLGLSNSLEGLSGAMHATVGGLEVSTDATVASNSSLTAGLTSAVGGMATAFATTLFGAILGGVFLKLLFSSTQFLADELVDKIEIVTETQLVPLLRASTSDLAVRRHDALMLLDKTAMREQARITSMAQSVDQYSERLEILMSKVANMPPLPRFDLQGSQSGVPRFVAFAKSNTNQIFLPVAFGAGAASLCWLLFGRLGS